MRARTVTATLLILMLTGCQAAYDRRAALHVPPSVTGGEAVHVVDDAAKRAGFREQRDEAGWRSYTADTYMIPGPTMGLNVRWDEGDSCVSVVLEQPGVSRESDAFRAAWQKLMLSVNSAFGPDRVTPEGSAAQGRAVLGGLFQLEEGD